MSLDTGFFQLNRVQVWDDQAAAELFKSNCIDKNNYLKPVYV